MVKVAETLRSLGEHLQLGRSVRNVYGDPVVVGGRTVIPIARVSYGFGAGGGVNEGEKAQSERGGSSGGAGMSARPGRGARNHRSGNALYPICRPGASRHRAHGRVIDRSRDRSAIAEAIRCRRVKRVNSALRFRHQAGRFRPVEGVVAAELPGAATDKLPAHAGSWSRRGGTHVPWTSLILYKFHRSESAA